MVLQHPEQNLYSLMETCDKCHVSADLIYSNLFKIESFGIKVCNLIPKVKKSYTTNLTH